MKTSYEEFEEIIPGVKSAGGFDALFGYTHGISDGIKFTEIIDDNIVKYLLVTAFNIPFESLGTAPMKVTFLSLLMMYRFYRSGKRKFIFDKEIMKLLLCTDISNVAGEAVRSPFPCIDINLENFPELKLYDQPIKNLFISIYEKDEFNYNFVSRHGYVMDADRVMFIMAYSKVGSSLETGQDDMFYWVVPFRNEEDLMEIVKNRLKRGDVTAKVTEMSYRILSFTINMLLYLTSSEVIIEHVQPVLKNRMSKNPKKHRRYLKHRDDPGHYKVSSTVTIKPFSAEVLELASREEEHRKLKGNWVVRGHWRSQAYGPGFSKRRTIWIHPFLKGNGIGDIMNRDYEVK